MNKNIALDIIITDLINQKINVQNKLNEVDKSINYINVKMREAKEPHKVEVKKVDVKTNDKICKFNRFGFCRERQSCPYFHAMKVCEDFFNSGVCTQQSCRERHPRRCTYFDSGECQWGSQCKYLHKGRNNVQRDDEDSNHKHDEESIESIMAKARAFELEESILDAEDSYKHVEESIESIMNKAKAFELDESFQDEEVQT